jgi:hypothetical protein
MNLTLHKEPNEANGAQTRLIPVVKLTAIADARLSQLSLTPNQCYVHTYLQA